MKYTTDIIIQKPLEEVIKLFDNQENMFKWQEGLQRVEQIEGDPGEPGAKMKLFFKIGKRKFEMVETIFEKELPEKFSGSYEAPGVYNEIHNSFEAIDENTTRWTSINEFRMQNFMMRLFGFIAPGMFRKQSRKIMEDFKRFAESE